MRPPMGSGRSREMRRGVHMKALLSKSAREILDNRAASSQLRTALTQKNPSSTRIEVRDASGRVVKSFTYQVVAPKR